MIAPRELPLPEHYHADRAASWSHQPAPATLAAAATAWAARHRIRPAARDRRRIELLLVDLQRDFCFPEGALFVGGRGGRGAVDDNDRIARFIYRNLERISGITLTLDTHHPRQIFFPDFWVDGEGRPLLPHREVTAAEIRAGAARPHPEMAAILAQGDLEWLEQQALDYCERLEAAGKYRLYLWPPHCLAGGDGHALAGVIQEARLFHAWARGARTELVVKGESPLTESYSALSPEVLEAHDGRPLGAANRTLIDRLLSADAVVVAGQAASHCVRATVEDLLAAAARRDPASPGKIWLLTDAMSPVAVPDPDRPGTFLADFTAAAETALATFHAAGAKLLTTTAPLPEP